MFERDETAVYLLNAYVEREFTRGFIQLVDGITVRQQQPAGQQAVGQEPVIKELVGQEKVMAGQKRKRVKAEGAAEKDSFLSLINSL